MRKAKESREIIMIVAGIDIGTAMMGVGILESGQGETPRVLCTRTITTPRQDIVRRSEDAFLAVVDILTPFKYDLHIIAIEDFVPFNNRTIINGHVSKEA